ncbi:MAG: hypothetical protein QXI58_00855 [Candidatus Micrarchaeia archaeon]
MPNLQELIQSFEEETNVKQSEISTVVETLNKLADYLEKEANAIEEERKRLKPIVGKKLPPPVKGKQRYEEIMKEEIKSGMEKEAIFGLGKKKPPKAIAFLRKALPYLGVATAAGGLGYILGYKTEQRKLSPYERELMKQVAATYYLAGAEEAARRKKAAEFLRKVAEYLELLYEKSKKAEITDYFKRTNEETNGIKTAENEISSSTDAVDNFINDVLNM